MIGSRLRRFPEITGDAVFSRAYSYLSNPNYRDFLNRWRQAAMKGDQTWFDANRLFSRIDVNI
jgi:hypothetical protein